MIKIEDLFPGAWVSYQGKPCRVFGLSMTGDVTISREEGGIDVLVQGLEPLILTDNMLFDNGFQKGTYVGGFLCENNFVYRIYNGDAPANGGEIEIGFGELFDEPFYVCRTVHELQRYLMTCGCPEIARNFQITEKQEENDND